MDGSIQLPGPRFAVVGVTGSGKTTTAQRLSRILNIPHVELDSLHWEKGWVQAERELFRQRVGQALSGDTWVTDGNYSKARDIIWSRAATLVWLDYNLPVVLWQLANRTLRRIIRREILWNGNRETFRGAFFSRDSLFLYAFSSQKKQRELYPRLLATEFAHLQVLHFRSREETNRWLNELSSAVCHRQFR
ncbi:MAG: adenylate kinase [Chloroflexi bacterium]|nr:adenylate kinase [Chloroflexota bacterium]